MYVFYYNILCIYCNLICTVSTFSEEYSEEHFNSILSRDLYCILNCNSVYRIMLFEGLELEAIEKSALVLVMFKMCQ